MMNIKGWRTIAFNVLSALVPIVTLSEWNAVFPPEWLPYWLLLVAVTNVYLRSITTTPVGRKA